MNDDYITNPSPIISDPYEINPLHNKRKIKDHICDTCGESAVFDTGNKHEAIKCALNRM